MKTKIILFVLFSLTTQASEVVFERDSSLPVVRIGVVFKGGAITDPQLKNGATDLMGRLMLRGTKSKTKAQIDLLLDQLGANLSFNTHAEYIGFQGSVLSENVKPFLELLSEVLTLPSFRPAEFEKLRKEQMSALQDNLGQDRELAKLRFEQVFFKGHPYSKSNNGRVSEIKNLTINDLQNQYQLLIQDSQMVVLGTGDAKQDDFEAFASSIKDKRKSTTSPLPLLEEFKSKYKKIHVVIIDKPDRTQTQVLIGQTGLKITSPEVDALTLANHAFGGGSFQSRLMVELRVKRGWTYGAGSVFKYGSQPHSWRMGFFPKNTDTPAAIVESLKMVRDLKEKGLTTEEFEFAKKSLVNGAGFSFNTPAKRLENDLIEKIFGLPTGYHREMAGRISKLTLEQVNQSLKNFLAPDRLFILVVATATKSKKDIAAALKIPESEIEVQDYLKD